MAQCPLRFSFPLLFVTALLSVSAIGQTSYSDNFEASALSPFWTVTQQNGTVTLSTELNHTATGNQSLQFSSSNTGDRKIGVSHQFPTLQKGVFSVWFFDTAPGAQTQYEQLSLANSASGDYVSIGTMDFDALCYEAQVNVSGKTFGPNANCGNYPQASTTNVNRTSGWHHFAIDVGVNSISLSIDGTLVYTSVGSFSYDLVSLLQTGPVAKDPDTSSYWDDFSFTGLTDFGVSAIGVQSGTTTVPLTLNTAGTLGAVKVVTQGTTGLDFQQSTSTEGACAPETTYVAGQTCTVNVVFTPKGIGPRQGAILLFDNSPVPNLLGTGYVTGVGSGGLVSFSTTQSTVGSGFTNPDDVAEDAAGNVYVTDLGNGRVVEVPAGCTNASCQITIASELSDPTNLAVDGAGRIFIADSSNNRVLVVSGEGGPLTTIGTGLSAPFGVAVDGSGNVYIANSGADNIIKVSADGNSQTVLASGFESPDGVALDAVGNLYVADNYSNRVVLVPSGGGAQTTVGTGLNHPTGVSLDGTGNVYIADAGSNSVIEVLATGGQVTLATGFNLDYGVNVDQTGNVFVADYANNRIVKVQQTQLPTTLSFGNVTVGTPGTQSLSFTNIGNAALSLSTGETPSQYTESDNCGGSVAVNASCTLNLSFAPTTGSASPGTTVPGSLTLTDNAPNSPQVVGLTAQAIAIAPTITTQPANQTITAGATATLSVTASGTAPLTYQWYSGNSPSTATPVSGQGSTFTTPALITTTCYWVQVNNETNVPANSVTACVSVSPVITTQPANQTISTGETATLSVVVLGTPVTYQWYSGTSPNTASLIPGATSPTFTTPVLTTTTNYWVQVSSGALPPVNSTTATVTVAKPSCTTGVQPTATAITEAVNVSCAATSNTTLNVLYIDWGDGTQQSKSPVGAQPSINFNPEHTYSAPGTYNVSLYVNGNSQPAETLMNVPVSAEPALLNVIPGSSASLQEVLAPPALLVNSTVQVTVTYQCTSVIQNPDTNPQTVSCDSVGISGGTMPQTVPLMSNTNFAIVVNTTAAQPVALIRHSTSASRTLLCVLFPGLGILTLIPFVSPRRRTALSRLLALFVAVGCLGVSSCGGSFNLTTTPTSGGSQGSNPTPAATYKVTLMPSVTSTSGNPDQTTLTNFTQSSLIVPIVVPPPASH